ncbi:DUF4230 domain-containing protein [Nonlabens antarcticus]|uniref:DUF4230 domain-containing protein n=1 Tax=Nonlabens antarcticus TaxID=392714 RepID=UPI001891BB91|nr:DUF4230 domain-containing protein [Nonlabens antarcticus]
MRRIKSFIIGAVIMLLIVMIYNYVTNRNDDRDTLTAQTALIEKQVRKVSKLVVTEATYAKVYTYENTKTYGWGDFYSSQKRALIVSNAKAQIAYDLRKMRYEIDADSKTIRILEIPEPEIKIDPDLSYYNLDNGITNRFEARDFNNMKRRITKDLRGKIIKSNIVKNAENRLLTELSQIYIIASSQGWTLEFDGSKIHSEKEWKTILD